MQRAFQVKHHSILHIVLKSERCITESIENEHEQWALSRFSIGYYVSSNHMNKQAKYVYIFFVFVNANGKQKIKPLNRAKKYVECSCCGKCASCRINVSRVNSTNNMLCFDTIDVICVVSSVRANATQLNNSVVPMNFCRACYCIQ